MFKLIYFVPVEALDTTKMAIFAAGAGQQGHYDQCAWQTLGHGQFRPLTGSNPFIGETEKLEVLEEYRVETLVDDSKIYDVLHALKQAHPYEEPAYDVIRLENF